jgi:hypothetical protein
MINPNGRLIDEPEYNLAEVPEAELNTDEIDAAAKNVAIAQAAEDKANVAAADKKADADAADADAAAEADEAAEDEAKAAEAA